MTGDHELHSASTYAASVALHREVTGEGATVVMLPSSGMSARQWKRLGEGLGQTGAFRVIAVDLLGTGKNAPWPDEEPFHFHDDVRAVGRVLDDLDVGKVSIVAHSYGALVGLTLARALPERVRSLALYEPVAMGVLHAEPPDPSLSSLAGEPLPSNPSGHFLDPAFGGTDAWLEQFIDYWSGKGAWNALLPQSQDEMRRVGKKVASEVRSLLADRTRVSAYAGVTAPSLLLSGSESPRAARRVAELVAGALPHGRFVSLSGLGHMAPITHGAMVNPQILEHLRLHGMADP